MGLGRKSMGPLVGRPIDSPAVFPRTLGRAWKYYRGILASLSVHHQRSTHNLRNVGLGCFFEGADHELEPVWALLGDAYLEELVGFEREIELPDDSRAYASVSNVYDRLQAVCERSEVASLAAGEGGSALHRDPRTTVQP